MKIRFKNIINENISDLNKYILIPTNIIRRYKDLIIKLNNSPKLSPELDQLIDICFSKVDDGRVYKLYNSKKKFTYNSHTDKYDEPFNQYIKIKQFLFTDHSFIDNISHFNIPHSKHRLEIRFFNIGDVRNIINNKTNIYGVAGICDQFNNYVELWTQQDIERLLYVCSNLMNKNDAS